ncbi:phosphatase PAP2 family protein [Ilumatobacter sp.]|uniref:phosphatase PAP2 family protein n=1 Tax=Ilumatobacter sp. TaxID=1967498 RepID=UPI003B530556
MIGASAAVLVAATRWPTWQQGAVACVVCAAVGLLLGRMRPTRTTEIVLPAVRELAVLTGLYALWRTAKLLPLVQSQGAMERARRIVEVQDAMGLPTELSLQRWVVERDPLGWLSAAYYAGMHVPALLTFLAWMFWRHRDAYGRWRDVLALTTAGCLLIRFQRVAPPRFLVDLGYVDLSEIHSMSVYGPVGTGVSGQFVAMPSIHVAWAAVIGFGIAASSPSRWRWLAAAHLPVTILVVVVTGHHWWLDGIVALVLVALAVVIDAVARSGLERWRRRGAPSPAERSELGGDGVEQLVVLGERAEPGELGDHVVR